MKTIMQIALGMLASTLHATVTFTGATSVSVDSSAWPTSLPSYQQSLSGSASASGTSALLTLTGHLWGGAEVDGGSRYSSGSYGGHGSAIGNWTAHWTSSSGQTTAPAQIHVHAKVYCRQKSTIGAGIAGGGNFGYVDLRSYSYFNSTSNSFYTELLSTTQWDEGRTQSTNGNYTYVLAEERDVYVSLTTGNNYNVSFTSTVLGAELTGQEHDNPLDVGEANAGAEAWSDMKVELEIVP